MFLQPLLPLLFLMTLFPQAAAPPASPPATLAPAALRISGKVIDAVTGQPLVHASVTMNPSNPSNAPNNLNTTDSGRVEITDAQGFFAFADVPPGKYVLFAGYRRYVAQTYQQHESFTTAIVVGPGLESENLIFGLRPGASISGVVADESDDPIRHADVNLYRELFTGGRRHIARIRRDKTDDEGHYRFSYLYPGTYFVGVVAQPWYAQHGVQDRVTRKDSDLQELLPEQNQALDVAYPVVFYSNATDLQGAAPLALHPGDTAVADFRMRPAHSIHVLVKVPAPDSEQSTGVSLTETVGEGESVVVPAEVINQSVPGLKEIAGVLQGRYNLLVRTFHGSAGTDQWQSVQLENGAEIHAPENGQSGAVSGILQVEDGSPVPQPTRVRLRTFPTEYVFDTNVSAKGEFSFKDGPFEPGKYELIILEPQGLFIRNLTSANAKTSGRSFEITMAQDVNVTINASKGSGQVTGVALKKDKPTSGTMIVLAPLDLKGNPDLFRRDQSDSDGTFTLNSVVPGRYTLMAIEDGWDLEWADPSVLQKFIAGGQSLQIAPNQKIDVTVKVQ
jgi:hypothetical protein